MRILVIDDEARRRVAKIVQYSQDPANWYLVGPGGKAAPGTTPGTIPNHVVDLNTYRCVFSYTKTEQGLFRHLSISIPSRRFPNPFIVFEIAQLFGFTGWNGESSYAPESWMISVNEQDHCVVLAEKV